MSETLIDPFEAAEAADRFLAEQRQDARLAEFADAERYATLRGKPLDALYREDQAKAAAEGRAGFRSMAEYETAAAVEVRRSDAKALEKELQRQRAAKEARRQLGAEDRASKPLPEFLSLAQRLERPRTELRFRIAGWQPAGARAMLSAQFKAGKTTLVGNLTRSLVDGDPFLGVAAVEPIEGRVAILDFEMSERQVEDWLADQRIEHPDRLILVALRGAASTFDITDEHVRAEWASRLRDHAVRYVVLDPLRPVLDALGMDENHDGGRFLTAFDELLAEAGIPEACVVHHMGHAGERSRGDSRFRDWPDVEWRLVRKSDDPNSERYVSAYGRDVDVSESRIRIDETTRRLTLVGGSRRDAEALAALDAVIDLLASEGVPMSGNAIEKALADTKHTQRAVRDALTKGAQIGSELGGQYGALHLSRGPRRAHMYSLPTSSLARWTSLGGADEVDV